MHRPSAIAVFVFGLAAVAVGVTFHLENRDRLDRKAKAEAERKRAELHALLSAIDRAEREARFVGTRTMTSRQGTSTHTTTVKLFVDGGRRHMEFVSTDTKGKKGPRSKSPYFGGLPSLFRPGKTGGGRIHDIDAILENYDVEVLPPRREADRDADVLRIRSRHAGRPSYVLAADRLTRFPLSFEVQDSSGGLIVRSEYESIDFAPEFPEGIFQKDNNKEALSFIRVTEKRVDPVGLSKQGGFEAWIPRDLPEGFKLVEATLTTIDVDPRMLPIPVNLRVLHLLYTDGLALFSVVQFPPDQAVWPQIRASLPPVQKADGIVARKFSHPSGTALLIELEHTVVILAGNISGTELETSAQTLIRD